MTLVIYVSYEKEDHLMCHKILFFRTAKITLPLQFLVTLPLACNICKITYSFR